MKPAYNEELLNYTLLQNEAEKLQRGGFIDKAQFREIENSLPGLHTQRHILMRIGLSLFGYFLISSCFGFISVIFLEGHGSGDLWKFMLLIDSIIAFVALEFVIRQRNYFAFGVDDAFLFTGIVTLLIFIGFQISDNSFVILFLTTAVIGVFCSYRYIDSFATFIACLGATGAIANFCISQGGWCKTLLPFILMANAAGLHLIYLRLKQSRRAFNIWGKCLKALYGYSLVLFYLAGNYMVVRVGTEELLNMDIPQGSDIPFAFIFYIFTIAVPVFYIYRGLKNKDRLILQIGILALAFGVYAIRYYHQVLPIEWGLILAGSVVFVIAYYSIKKLQDRTTGLTFKPDRFTDTGNILNVEAIIIAESFGLKEHTPQTDETTFGGGQFGGGGAGDGY